MQHSTTAVKTQRQRGDAAFALATVVLLLLGPQAPVWGQAFKCKQPNGSMSFQDHPCASDSPGTDLTLKPLNNGATEAYGQSPDVKAGGAAGSSQGKKGSAAQQAEDDKVKANNEKVMAHNREVLCNKARRQLEILKTPTRVFRRDNNGERQFVSDDDRPAEVAAAQKRVNEACN